MAKKSRDAEDLDFLLNEDSGEIDLFGLKDDDEDEDEEDDEQEVEENDEEESDDEEEQEGEDEEEDEEEESSPSKGFDSRLKNVEVTLQNLPNMIANAIGTAMNQKQTKVEEDDDIPEELDNKGLVNILVKRIDKAVKQQVGDALRVHQPALESARLSGEFQSLAGELGQPFVDRMPLVARAMLDAQEQGGSLTVKGAWNIVKNFPVPGKAGKKSTVTREMITGAKKNRSDADSQDAKSRIAQSRTQFKPKKGTNDAEEFERSFNAALVKEIGRSKRSA